MDFLRNMNKVRVLMSVVCCVILRLEFYMVFSLWSRLLPCEHSTFTMVTMNDAKVKILLSNFVSTLLTDLAAQRAAKDQACEGGHGRLHRRPQEAARTGEVSP